MRTDRSHWDRVCHELGWTNGSAKCYQRLVVAYSDQTRHYHNLRHIAECLAELDLVRSVAQFPAELEMAIWFHDAVYDPRAANNEEKSARLATDWLARGEAASHSASLVSQLILLTKTHESGDVPDAGLLIDIDLAILGQAAERFWNYEHAIRAEYAWVQADVFATKRAEVLKRFLNRPAIYRTEYFRTKYESAARMNLRAAIERLKNPTAEA